LALAGLVALVEHLSHQGLLAVTQHLARLQALAAVMGLVALQALKQAKEVLVDQAAALRLVMAVIRQLPAGREMPEVIHPQKETTAAQARYPQLPVLAVVVVLLLLVQPDRPSVALVGMEQPQVLVVLQ